MIIDMGRDGTTFLFILRVFSFFYLRRICYSLILPLGALSLISLKNCCLIDFTISLF